MEHETLSSHSPADTFTPPADSALWRKNFLLGAATASYQIEGAYADELGSVSRRFASPADRL
ncbi:hypothetical protein C0Z16_07665 [Paraburkholderia rhynchosiae]|uniref:Uncharacterized protein n=1 Tax=Paraburkholderia rhynchosiae TaxID=487049 RepID=A0ABX4VC22_9BURK|nr:hypothetical protein C0Z16_07665 [Paraburkholderia rhynchosiae]